MKANHDRISDQRRLASISVPICFWYSHLLCLSEPDADVPGDIVHELAAEKEAAADLAAVSYLGAGHRRACGGFERADAQRRTLRHVLVQVDAEPAGRPVDHQAVDLAGPEVAADKDLGPVAPAATADPLFGGARKLELPILRPIHRPGTGQRRRQLVEQLAGHLLGRFPLGGPGAVAILEQLEEFFPRQVFFARDVESPTTPPPAPDHEPAADHQPGHRRPGAAHDPDRSESERKDDAD